MHCSKLPEGTVVDMFSSPCPISTSKVEFSKTQRRDYLSCPRADALKQASLLHAASGKVQPHCEGHTRSGSAAHPFPLLHVSRIPRQRSCSPATSAVSWVQGGNNHVLRPKSPVHRGKEVGSHWAFATNGVPVESLWPSTWISGARKDPEQLSDPTLKKTLLSPLGLLVSITMVHISAKN